MGSTLCKLEMCVSGSDDLDGRPKSNKSDQWTADRPMKEEIAKLQAAMNELKQSTDHEISTLRSDKEMMAQNLQSMQNKLYQLDTQSVGSDKHAISPGSRLAYNEHLLGVPGPESNKLRLMIGQMHSDDDIDQVRSSVIAHYNDNSGVSACSSECEEDEKLKQDVTGLKIESELEQVGMNVSLLTPIMFGHNHGHESGFADQDPAPLPSQPPSGSKEHGLTPCTGMFRFESEARWDAGLMDNYKEDLVEEMANLLVQTSRNSPANKTSHQ